jgi:hypothetical protein
VQIVTDTLSRLRGLAEKATPGPWTVHIAGQRGYYTIEIPESADHERKHMDEPTDGHSVTGPMRDYIAALDPQTVLAMIDCIAAADAMRERSVAEHDGISLDCVKCKAVRDYDAARAALEKVKP